MAISENAIVAENVYSEDDIISALEQVLKENSLTLSEKETLDYIARITYFFNRAEYVKLTPSFNPNLKYETKNGQANPYRKLVTVPRKVNNFYEYQKGKFIPVCKFSAVDDKKASHNEFLISIDFENKVVLANVSTIKYIYGYKPKVIDTFCSGVANFVIPDPNGLMRGKIKDLVARGRNMPNLRLDYNDFDKFNDTIAKSVIAVSRMDLDSRHGNNYEVVPGYNKAQKRILDDYFRKFADPPHFHFVYRDYVLNRNLNDSSALAINVEGLAKYLVDLNHSQITDEIMMYPLGMPFVDIKKGNVKLSADKVEELTSNMSALYNDFTKSNKEDFYAVLKANIERLTSRLIKMKCSELQCENFTRDAYRIIDIITGKEKANPKESYDALIVLGIQTSAVSAFYNFSRLDTYLKTDVGKFANDLFNTINVCLEKTALDKEKDNTTAQTMPEK